MVDKEVYVKQEIIPVKTPRPRELERVFSCLAIIVITITCFILANIYLSEFNLFPDFILEFPSLYGLINFLFILNSLIEQINLLFIFAILGESLILGGLFFRYIKKKSKFQENILYWFIFC